MFLAFFLRFSCVFVCNIETFSCVGFALGSRWARVGLALGSFLALGSRFFLYQHVGIKIMSRLRLVLPVFFYRNPYQIANPTHNVIWL